MVGYLTASLKNVRETRVGDTVTEVARPCAEATSGLQEGKPDGILRTVSGGRGKVSGSAGCPGKAAAQ